MPRRKSVKINRCNECGAELELDSASCPLCGAEPDAKKDWSAPRRQTAKVADIDEYQAGVRDLRERLRKLREEASA